MHKNNRKEIEKKDTWHVRMCAVNSDSYSLSQVFKK